MGAKVHRRKFSGKQRKTLKWTCRHIATSVRIGAGDYLAERGWVLLHNPSQGIAEPTRTLRRNYTKAQKEFLYDYYMERNKENKANEVWEE